MEVDAKGVDILNPKLTVDMINKPERVLTMVDEEEINMGQASYYPTFLFWKESKQDTLCYDLNLCFNQPGIECSSSVTFKVDALDNTNDYQILMNGELCPANQFVADRQMGKSVLSIVFDKNAAQGKRYFSVTPIKTVETDRINANSPENYELSIRAKYTVNTNPLFVMLIGLLIVLIAILILWFFVVRIIVYPHIKLGRIIITEPYYKSKRIQNARKVVFTNKPMKQGVLNRIFTGQIVYENNEVWTDPIEFEPCKKALKPVTKSKYLITPFTTRMEKNTEYEIQNIATNQQIKITIN